MMARTMPKSRFIFSLLFLFCLTSLRRASSERIDIVHKSDGNALTEGINSEGGVSPDRELFWVSNKHLPAWRDFKYQQQIQRRRRRRRRRRQNGYFKKPSRWNGTGFRQNQMMNMNMNMMGMKMMNMKKRMKPRQKMMNWNPDNLNFQPIMTRGMMKMRPMRANSLSSTEALSDSQKFGMKLTWGELAQRRRNMRMRAKRRIKRRQWRMQQRLNERIQQQENREISSGFESDRTDRSIPSSGW